ncbi:hypothetical protein B0H12DRAFT_1151541 [Mycena haematopus]|nr:hypothetical protein B0H12DRAFT_1151541 [Mycena haematopus]
MGVGGSIYPYFVRSIFDKVTPATILLDQIEAWASSFKLQGFARTAVQQRGCFDCHSNSNHDFTPTIRIASSDFSKIKSAKRNKFREPAVVLSARRPANQARPKLLIPPLCCHSATILPPNTAAGPHSTPPRTSPHPHPTPNSHDVLLLLKPLTLPTSSTPPPSNSSTPLHLASSTSLSPRTS